MRKKERSGRRQHPSPPLADAWLLSSERDGTKTHAERDVMKPYTFMKGLDRGRESDVFEDPEGAMGGSGPECFPNSSQGGVEAGSSGQEKTRKPLADKDLRASSVGRRDWTRTNDPHHVKVVL